MDGTSRRSSSRSRTTTGYFRSPSQICVATLPPSAFQFNHVLNVADGQSVARGAGPVDLDLQLGNFAGSVHERACDAANFDPEPGLLFQGLNVVPEDFDDYLPVDLRDALENVVPNRLREAGLIMWRFHWSWGQMSTRNSAMLICLGSVPSSGRKALETTARTASVTEIPGGRVKLTHTTPSFSSGRNSLPKPVASARLTPNAVAATNSTTMGRWTAGGLENRPIQRENSSEPSSADTMV